MQILNNRLFQVAGALALVPAFVLVAGQALKQTQADLKADPFETVPATQVSDVKLSNVEALIVNSKVIPPAVNTENAESVKDCLQQFEKLKAKEQATDVACLQGAKVLARAMQPLSGQYRVRQSAVLR